MFLSSIHRLAPEAVSTLEQDQDAAGWAARFGLHQVYWFVEVANSTLHWWQTDPTARQYPTLGLMGWGRVVHELPAIRAWAYEDESEAAFDARIAQHKDDVRAVAASRGLSKTRELRNPLYVEWLVRRVIQRWNVDQIAAAYQTAEKSYDNSTIQRGINEAAELVGIPRPATLRPQ